MEVIRDTTLYETIRLAKFHGNGRKVPQFLTLGKVIKAKFGRVQIHPGSVRAEIAITRGMTKVRVVWRGRFMVVAFP